MCNEPVQHYPENPAFSFVAGILGKGSPLLFGIIRLFGCAFVYCSSGKRTWEGVRREYVIVRHSPLCLAMLDGFLSSAIRIKELLLVCDAFVYCDERFVSCCKLINTWDSSRDNNTSHMQKSKKCWLFQDNLMVGDVYRLFSGWNLSGNQNRPLLTLIWTIWWKLIE